MKKLFLTFLIVLVSLSFFSCGKISTLDFYKACLTGKEELVNKYISQEEYSLELTDKEIEKFVKTLEDFDSDGLFWLDYEDIFIDNPIAVSILGKNESITKTLCENISFSEDDEDDIIYTTAKMNDTAMGIYLYEQRIFPITYLSFITMIENDNVDMFKLFSVIIDDLTAEVYKTGENFLILAVKNNSVNCVKYLIDSKKFDINAMNSDFKTALGIAYDVGASDEIKTYLKKAGGKYIRKPYLDFITEMNRLTNILLDHCDKSKYSHSEVMEIVHDMGYSGTFMDRANELSKKCAGLEPTELESKYLFKSMDDFDSAFAKLQSNRMYN